MTAPTQSTTKKITMADFHALEEEVARLTSLLKNRLTSEEVDSRLIPLTTEILDLKEMLNAAPPAEAGFSWNQRFVHPKRGGAQATARSAFASGWRQTMRDFDEFTADRIAQGWDFDVPTPNTPPQPSRAAAIASEAGNSTLAAQLQAVHDDVPAAQNGDAWLTFRAERFIVEAAPDNKVNLAFRLKASNNFNDFSGRKWSADRAREFLSHITDVDKIFITLPDGGVVVKPCDIQASVTVYYLLGNEYTISKGPNTGKKDHYKDMYHARLTK